MSAAGPIIGINYGHDAGIGTVDGSEVRLWELEKSIALRHACGGEPAAGPAIAAQLNTVRGSGVLESIGVCDYVSPRANAVLDALTPAVGEAAWAPNPHPSLTSMTMMAGISGSPFARALGIERVRVVRHHWAHAALAYHTSRSQHALVLILDGTANFGECGLVAIGHGERLTPLASLFVWPGPRIGMLYEWAARELFGSHFDTGKVLGLAAYGTVDTRWSTAFRSLCGAQAWREANASVATPLDHELLASIECSVDGQRWQSPGADHASAASVLHLPRYFRIRGGDADSAAHLGNADLAACLQHAVEADLTALATGLLAAFPEVDTLCYAGGCALNINANSRIARAIAPVALHIPSCCDDSGIALGVALAVAQAESRLPEVRPTAFELAIAGSELDRETAGPGQYFGTNRTVHAASLRELIGTASALLRDGSVLGWIHGQIETGPRALGQRSILASPFVDGMRRRVSEDIKQRESFRPLGVACAIEYASQDFDGPGGPTPTMLFAWQARRERRSIYGEILHRDGSVRLQTVDRVDAPVLHELLAEFGRMAPAPVLFNTSLNPGGLPILNRLSDAIAMVDRDGLDALVDVDRLTIHFSRSHAAPGVGVTD